MRCFIAIDIDDQIRKGLSDLQDELRKKVDIRKGDVKWVRPELTHLTLKFLGEIKDEQVVEVCNITKDVASRHKRFELDIESVGQFGGRSARVMWIGTGQGSDELLQLQEDLEQQLDIAGWPKDTRKFSAHLTLCRIRSSKAGYELSRLSGQYQAYKLGTMPAYDVSVYQSELTPQGPIYTTMGSYALR
jgi:2'-5' RNA ligase